MMYPTDAIPPTHCLRPLEEGQQGTRRGCLVAKIEMVGIGAVEIDRHLYQGKTEDVAIKAKGLARVPADERDMMESSGDELGHTGSCAINSPDRRRRGDRARRET